MKKITLLLLAFISLNIFSQSTFRTVIVEWDDTVTVRDVSSLDIYRVVNYDHRVYSLPVLGLAPNLEAFVYKEFSNMPDVDYRLYNVLVQEGCIDSLDSEWNSNRIYARQYSIVARDSTELFESVEQEENLANFGVFPYQRQFKYMLMYMAYLERKVDGLSIPNALQVVADRVNAKQNLIWQNYLNAQSKKDAIRNEENFDIDLGWNNTDPE